MTHVYFYCSGDRGILIDQYDAAVDTLVEARTTLQELCGPSSWRTAQRIAGIGSATSAMMLASKFSWCPSRSYSASRIERLKSVVLDEH